MARFEDLQQLWQSQSDVQVADVPVDVRGTADALSRFGRRQNVVNILKILLIAWQTWVCLSRLGLSWQTVVGQAMFVTGVANMLVADWRNQLGIARLDFSRPSAGFVESALDQLRDPNAPIRKRFWLQIVLIVVGVNMVISARPQYSLWAHIVISACLCAAYALGLKIRGKRYELEYRPIKRQLLTLKRALEEQSL
jgi:hypothetical protein